MDLRNRHLEQLLQEGQQQSSWCATLFGISSSTVSGTRGFNKRSRTLFVVGSMELLIITTVHPKLAKTTKRKTSEKWSECIWNFSLTTLTFINDEKYLCNWKSNRLILSPILRSIFRNENLCSSCRVFVTHALCVMIRGIKSQYSQNFSAVLKVYETSKTKFHVHTTRESHVVRSKKSKFIVRSIFSCSTLFLFIDILLKLQQQTLICFYQFSCNSVIIMGLLRFLMK